MKKVLFILFPFILIGCNEINEDQFNDILCTPNHIIVQSWDDMFTIMVQSKKSWSATTDKSWVDCTPLSGLGDAYVSIKTSAGKPDTAHVIFTNGTRSQVVTICRVETDFFSGTIWSGNGCISRIEHYSSDTIQLTMHTIHIMIDKMKCHSFQSYDSMSKYPNLCFDWSIPGETEMGYKYNMNCQGVGRVYEDETGKRCLIVRSEVSTLFPDAEFNYVEKENSLDTLYLVQ